MVRQVSNFVKKRLFVRHGKYIDTFVRNPSGNAVLADLKRFTKIGKERGWPPVTRAQFDSQIGLSGALVIGSPEEVAQKMIRHSQALGGISRFTFQLDNAGLSHKKLIKSIEVIIDTIISFNVVLVDKLTSLTFYFGTYN